MSTEDSFEVHIPTIVEEYVDGLSVREDRKKSYYKVYLYLESIVKADSWGTAVSSQALKKICDNYKPIIADFEKIGLLKKHSNHSSGTRCCKYKFIFKNRHETTPVKIPNLGEGRINIRSSNVNEYQKRKRNWTSQLDWSDESIVSGKSKNQLIRWFATEDNYSGRLTDSFTSISREDKQHLRFNNQKLADFDIRSAVPQSLARLTGDELLLESALSDSLSDNLYVSVYQFKEEFSKRWYNSEWKKDGWNSTASTRDIGKRVLLSWYNQSVAQQKRNPAHLFMKKEFIEHFDYVVGAKTDAGIAAKNSVDANSSVEKAEKWAIAKQAQELEVEHWLHQIVISYAIEEQRPIFSIHDGAMLPEDDRDKFWNHFNEHNEFEWSIKEKEPIYLPCHANNFPLKLNLTYPFLSKMDIGEGQAM
ncbi:MAG: hypothetical protein JKY95_11525 [Planctomycetaceae bacterium]|nr:hypothetical protein [Planctomycetaceae bacterium]